MTDYRRPEVSDPPPAARSATAQATPKRAWLLSVLVAALVAAGVGGGMVAALDDSPSSAPGAAEAIRPSSRLAEPGDVRAVLERVQPAVVAISTTGFTSDAQEVEDELRRRCLDRLGVRHGPAGGPRPGRLACSADLRSEIRHEERRMTWLFQPVVVGMVR